MAGLRVAHAQTIDQHQDLFERAPANRHVGLSGGARENVQSERGSEHLREGADRRARDLFGGDYFDRASRQGEGRRGT